MSVFERILALLEEHHIPYKLTEHEPVRTSEQAARVRGAELKTGAKAMIVRGKDNHYLLVLPADKQIDWKRVRAILHVSNLRFATEEEAESVAHVKMGSVPPFGNILGLPTYFDKGLFENDVVNFNPGSTTHSIAMKSADLRILVSPIIASFAK
ncbi:MAG TPA: YbaK/EbsC family protein [Ktedonobacteraceae bacterium]|jgi:Ala-tRNA(Pro) deacylase|nr:YbaK/EbsC family protein [Ktedonobacteraceae bacterium]